MIDFLEISYAEIAMVYISHILSGIKVAIIEQLHSRDIRHACRVEILTNCKEKKRYYVRQAKNVLLI